MQAGTSLRSCRVRRRIVSRVAVVSVERGSSYVVWITSMPSHMTHGASVCLGGWRLSVSESWARGVPIRTVVNDCIIAAGAPHPGLYNGLPGRGRGEVGGW